jgi:hypothetical protein
MSSTHKRSVADEPVTSVLPGGDVPYDPSHEFDADEEVLAALGYKSEFKREFGLFTTFCVSFAVLGLLPSFASTLYYGMGYAGTAGMWIRLSVLGGVSGRQRWNLADSTRNDVGMDRSHDRYPVRGMQHGRAV